MAEESVDDVRKLGDEELKALEESMSRNRDEKHLVLLRTWKIDPANDFEQRYVNVCNELQRRGLLDVA